MSSADLWYGFVYVEHDYTYNPADAAIRHIRRVVLAESTDQGATWTYVGDILTPSASAIPGAPAGAENYGDGDQRLVVDSANGYLYLYYTTGYYLPGQTMSTGNPVSWSNVARCPIAQIARPGCWRKWAGSWSAATPGVGGAEIGQADRPDRGGRYGTAGHRLERDGRARRFGDVPGRARRGGGQPRRPDRVRQRLRCPGSRN